MTLSMNRGALAVGLALLLGCGSSLPSSEGATGGTGGGNQGGRRGDLQPSRSGRRDLLDLCGRLGPGRSG